MDSVERRRRAGISRGRVGVRSGAPRNGDSRATHASVRAASGRWWGALFFALSPDGRSVVVQTTVNNQFSLVVRSLESGEERTLAGTELARAPFWSPDSRTIAFYADNKLKVVRRVDDALDRPPPIRLDLLGFEAHCSGRNVPKNITV